MPMKRKVKEAEGHDAAPMEAKPASAKHKRKPRKGKADGADGSGSAPKETKPAAATPKDKTKKRKKRGAEGDTAAVKESKTPLANKKANTKAPKATMIEDPKDSGPALYLLKSEPKDFSIDDLATRPGQTEPWDGVRNAQARNIMQRMKLGDQCLFYHSNTREPGVVGVCEVVREAHPDETALDPESPKYDPKSTSEKPRWFMVDVKFVRKLERIIPLQELKQHSSGSLEGMVLLTRGRLSVQPVTKQQWEFIMQLEPAPPEKAS